MKAPRAPVNQRSLGRLLVTHGESPIEFGLDKRYIPLPLRLRSLALAEAGSLEERIWNAITHAHDLIMDGPRPPPGYFEKWPKLLNTPWLLLLDGFDEVPEQSRPDIIAFIRKLIEARTPFLLTSRPTYDLPQSVRDSVRQHVIEPFSLEQQHQFAQMWLGSDAADFETAFSKIAAGELGRTPLLLTIAANIYQESRDLPVRRSELYRIFVEDTWQEAWRRRRGTADELGTELSEVAPAIVPLCLRKIARVMTEARGESSALDFGADPSALVDLIKEVLVAELRLSNSVASFRAEKLLKFLGGASGVFRATKYQCEWLHPTFREFLAAEDLVARANDGSIQNILRRFKDPGWRQVALFVLSNSQREGLGLLCA